MTSLLDIKSILDFQVQLEHIDISSILTPDFIQSIRYLGFDTESILEVVNKYINSGDEQERTENISKLIYLGMKRGNRVSKIIETSKDEKAKWLKKLVEELNIKDNIKDETGEPSNRTLTLSRLKKACPRLAYNILRQPNFKRRVTAKMIRNKIPEFEFLPLIARDMCVMSLLPKKITVDFGEYIMSIMITHIFIYCLCESALLVNPKNKNEGVKLRAEDVLKYMVILWNAEHINDEDRKVQAKEIKNYYESLKDDEKNALRTQSGLIEDYAGKYGLDILKSFDFRQ